ncbi:hypothetical protein WICMUC_003467 [Wickerhamomyces mucosus]|uniref:Uncharacterized protein n=1 Tax=Wickerhamomyces mucosus TaxID=1378264 RepID=A0A9P8TD77_9ASCO|nr:hypothetical protein WICMUC_003467 [Wickerhamomyces mucosus]
MVSRISPLTISNPPISSHVTLGILGAPIESLNLFLASLIDFSKSSGVKVIGLFKINLDKSIPVSIEKSSSLSNAKYLVLLKIEIRSRGVKPALCKESVDKETSFLILKSLLFFDRRYSKIKFRSSSEGTGISISNLKFERISSGILSASFEDATNIAPLEGNVFSELNWNAFGRPKYPTQSSSYVLGGGFSSIDPDWCKRIMEVSTRYSLSLSWSSILSILNQTTVSGAPEGILKFSSSGNDDIVFANLESNVTGIRSPFERIVSLESRNVLRFPKIEFWKIADSEFGDNTLSTVKESARGNEPNVFVVGLILIVFGYPLFITNKGDA